MSCQVTNTSQTKYADRFTLHTTGVGQTKIIVRPLGVERCATAWAQSVALNLCSRQHVQDARARAAGRVSRVASQVALALDQGKGEHGRGLLQAHTA